MTFDIEGAVMPKSCITLDGKYCFYIEYCKAFKNADFTERREHGLNGRLHGCPIKEVAPKNGTFDCEYQSKDGLVPSQTI